MFLQAKTIYEGHRVQHTHKKTSKTQRLSAIKLLYQFIKIKEKLLSRFAPTLQHKYITKIKRNGKMNMKEVYW